MYSKIGKEYAENHSDYINTCSVLPYGIKFVGIEAGDEEGDKHNEKADIANARNGISVPAGRTTMIFEYVKQNKITEIYAVRFEKNLLAKNHTFHNIHIFNIRLIK